MTLQERLKQYQQQRVGVREAFPIGFFLDLFPAFKEGLCRLGSVDSLENGLVVLLYREPTPKIPFLQQHGTALVELYRKPAKFFLEGAGRLVLAYRIARLLTTPREAGRLALLCLGKAPEHPDTLVIPSNPFYPRGLTEQEIYDHFMAHKEDILETLENRPYMEVRLLAGGRPLRLRNQAPLTKSNYEDKITGRTVELHGEFRAREDRGYVDIDPKEQVPWSRVREVTRQVTSFLSRHPEIQKTSIQFSGSRGFHIFVEFPTQRSIDRIRRFLKERLDEYAQRHEDTTTEVTKDPKQIRLDYTLNKRRGTFKVPYSLDRRTGLVVLPLTKTKLASFQPKEARISPR